jgi:pilus assembly protein CpaC
VTFRVGSRNLNVGLAAVFASSLALIAFPSDVLAQGRTAAPGSSGSGTTSTGGQSEELGLAVNETKSIPGKDIKNYLPGDQTLIDVRYAESTGQFLITGKKAGSTTLVLIKNDNSQVTWVINVTTKSPEVVYHELQQLLEGETGVRIRRVGGRFFLEGGVTTESQLHRIQQITLLYPGQVENLVGVGSGAGDRRLLIRIDFFFVQYDKNNSYAVGIGYPGSIGGDTVVSSTFSYDLIQRASTATAAITNQPLPRLDIAARNGWARVLKQSSIITSNGTEATFNSGGEVNFRQFAFNSASGVQKISFGTNISVLPRYDSNSREIEIKVVGDVSDLTTPATTASGDLPGRDISHLETLVNLKLGQALILAGIKSAVRQHDVAGLPLLSQIPVLGILFGSHSDKNQEVENAMFVIPSVVETVPKSSLELIKTALAQYKDYSGDIDSVNTFDRTPPAAK